MNNNKNLLKEFTGNKEEDRLTLRELVKAIRNAKQVLQTSKFNLNDINTSKIENQNKLENIFYSIENIYNIYEDFIGGKIFNLKSRIKADIPNNSYRQLEPYFKYLSAFDYTTSASYGIIKDFTHEENETALNNIFMHLDLYFHEAPTDDVRDPNEELIDAIKYIRRYRYQAIDELNKAESIIINLGKRLYASDKFKSNNKYVEAFRESCKKLEEKQNLSNWYWNDIPPEKFTDRELEAKSQFDKHIEDFQNGLITRKELAYKLYELIDVLPDSDWTRDSDAKLPDELFPKNI